MEKHPSSNLSYWLFLTFLLKKQRLSPAKNLNSPSVCGKIKSALLTKISGNFPPENSLRPREWQSRTVSCLLMVIMYNYVIWLCHFPGCLVGQDFNHYTLQQHLYDCKLSAGLDRQGEHLGKHWSTSTWRVLNSDMCELHTWRQRCFTLCESPSADNWRTTAPEIMRRRCVKRASVKPYVGVEAINVQHVITVSLF